MLEQQEIVKLMEVLATKDDLRQIKENMSSRTWIQDLAAKTGIELKY